MANAPLKVPVVPGGLRPTETYLQLFDSLEALSKSVDDVFGKITDRLQSERKKLDVIGTRINSAEGKIKRITGSTKATTVYSPAKYPAKQYLEPIKPLVTEIHASAEPRRSKYRLNISEHPHIPSLVGSTPDSNFFVPAPKTGLTDRIIEGFGYIPRSTPSVANLLLFNTQESPFRRYKHLDPLEGIEFIEDTVTEKKTEIGDQPQTLLTGDDLPASQFMELGYKPGMDNLPEMALPDYLPGLAGVAEINWNTVDTFQPIAPSVGIDLPEVAVAGPDSTPTPAAPAADSAGAPPPPPPPVSSGGGPPPPPPPPPISPGGPPPPAPPPPADRHASPDPGPTFDDDDDSPSGDARNDLLAAIRKGKSLKPAGERKMKAKKPKADDGDAEGGKKSTGSGGGMVDLFGDLISALDRRRKGLTAQLKPTREERPAAADAIIAPVPIDVTASDDIGANKSPSKTLSVFQRGEEEQDDDFDDEEDENWGEE